jgi:hypothetical protein
MPVLGLDFDESNRAVYHLCNIYARYHAILTTVANVPPIIPFYSLIALRQ